MVYKLCQYDPGLLFQRLEQEAQNWMEQIRSKLVQFMASSPKQRTFPYYSLFVSFLDRANEFLALLAKYFENLNCANEILVGMLTYLQNCFLKQFDITFADLNRVLLIIKLSY